MLDKAIKFFITLTLAIIGGAALHQASPFLISYINLEFFQIETGIFELTLASLVCILLGAFIGGLAGFFVSPYLIDKLRKFTSFVEKQLSKMPIYDVIAGAIGLAIGLILANLLGSAFSRIPIVGNYIPIIFSLVLGYLGVRITIKKRKELTSSLDFIPHMIKDILRSREAAKAEKEAEKVAEKPVQEENSQVEQPSKVNLVKLKEHKDKNYKLLDTNVIIDGRIADISKTGFLEGTLLIPVFVLEELQYIADSPDTLRRVRGRRGLDVLQKIRDMETHLEVEIMNVDFDDIQGVDSKLVRLAQKLGGKIITNDFNLNKVAQLRGVEVLNINELSNAVKPVVIPGETMKVQVVKDGKEPGQGVAYLDDGTMIVIENGHRYLSRTISVEVTSALQTAAGRMIFAKPR
ncbi:MAG: PIN/TRAM domain-containing protein [Selenomonadaceae bacterium]|nr:PIN/TRAM domain-containing protein [Selenomonadaceae bacterium]MBQ7492799.1 PIN/TRAM domain-containing protein [Selenomonadaceae bacterium]